MASTESVPAPAPTPRLMALAPELRNRIWTDVFKGTTVSIDSILLMSQQVHNEAIGLYYNCSIFQPRMRNPFFIAEWLNRIPYQYVALVTNVRFDTNAYFPPITTSQDTVVGDTGSILLTDLGGDYSHAARVKAAKIDIARIRGDLALNDRLHLLQEEALKASVLMPDSRVARMSFPSA
ncbi:hypothetical protein LTR97_007857 [Elasticomyces elasticus]|uniref:Uncharacterized protein n=1 Tax=Elasticomyces elasticus TaxID=574655 RepID=A0AAN7W400_9PEZI|nr:hypothetical protein LTR97_007857 [Elasticomyces elasticus]